MNAVIDVVHAGFAHVTDLGRPGYGRRGVAVNGAADQLSARLANALVGNPDGHPVVELVAAGCAFRARDPVLVAVTGAPAAVTVDGCRADPGQPVVLGPGSELRVVPGPGGLRRYVAVRGRIDAAGLLGSCAPDATLGIGNALAAGGTMRVATTFRPFRHPHLPLFRFDRITPYTGPAATLDVLDGPQAGWFPGGRELLAATAYTVGPDSDHVGLRMLGPVPERDRGHELLSRGVPVGAVEIPPSGGLITLARGRVVTAGYPVIAVVTRASRDLLGQLPPGSAVRFRYVSPEAARAAYREREDRLVRIRQRVATALAAAGVPDL